MKSELTKNKPSKKFIYITFLIVCVLFVVFGFLSIQKLTSPSHTVVWNEYVSKQGAPMGHLYELHNDTEGIGIYISSESKIVPESYEIADGWKIIYHSYADVWNPRVCAVMPSIISSTGDIFMLGAVRDENTPDRKYSWSLIWFGNENKKLLKANIDEFKYVGEKLFLDGGNQPFYFSEKDGALYTYSLNPSTKELEEKRVKEMQSTERVRISRDVKDFSPIVGIYDVKSLLDKKYRYVDGILQEFSGSTEVPASTTPNEQVISTHLHEITSAFILGSPYETKVLQGQHKILEFKKEAKVYSYVIGSYRLSN